MSRAMKVHASIAICREEGEEDRRGGAGNRGEGSWVVKSRETCGEARGSGACPGYIRARG